MSNTLTKFFQFSLCSFKNTSRPIYRTLGKSTSIYCVNVRFRLSHFSPDFASDLTVWCIHNAFTSFLIYILILLDFCIFLFVLGWIESPVTKSKKPIYILTSRLQLVNQVDWQSVHVETIDHILRPFQVCLIVLLMSCEMC